MRSRKPPGRFAGAARVPVMLEVEAVTEPLPFPALEVLVRRDGAAENEWVRPEPDGEGRWILPFACTIYGWRMIA